MAEVELLELYRTEADDARRGTSRAWVAALRHAGEEAKRQRDAIFGVNCDPGGLIYGGKVGPQARSENESMPV